MMGAGIAYVSAMAGIAVVLKDVDLAAAEKGKARSAALLDKRSPAVNSPPSSAKPRWRGFTPPTATQTWPVAT